jgi:hypothetical protein
MKTLMQIDPKYGVAKTDAGELVIAKNKTGEPVPSDEPMCVFRGRDWHALEMLRYYRQLCEDDGCTPEHMAGIDNRIQAFLDFAATHLERMKQPGITRGM